jgi:YesN/AraC family two-component response regulator
MVKILVVDDETDVEPLFVQKFRKDIREKEFEFHFAFSGEDALRFMSGLQPFDLVMVLSDINMPGMTGLELLRKTKEKFPQLRVMMITAYGDTANYEKAMSYGADEFLTKPIDFNLLKEKIMSIQSPEINQPDILHLNKK